VQALEHKQLRQVVLHPSACPRSHDRALVNERPGDGPGPGRRCGLPMARSSTSTSPSSAPSTALSPSGDTSATDARSMGRWALATSCSSTLGVSRV
jgi:hypothetical protein